MKSLQSAMRFDVSVLIQTQACRAVCAKQGSQTEQERTAWIMPY